MISSFKSFAVTAIAAVLLGIFPAAPAWARPKADGDIGKAVDSGSFGVFASGERVATETFSIRQGPDGSLIESEFKSVKGEQNADQSSELRLAPSADLKSYEWKETAPEKNMASVTTDGTFLVERFGEMNESKQHAQSFLLPPSTSILDDYAFVQREVLAWKYLAMACNHGGKLGPECPLKQKTHFGILNPHLRSSMSVSIQFTGMDKITWHGAEHEFSRFLLESEAGNWEFWLDDQLKLVRLLIEDGTEVVRD